MAAGMSYFKKLGNMVPFIKEKQEQTDYARAMNRYKAGAYVEAIPLLEKMIGETSLQGHLARFYHARACRLEAERLLKQNNYSVAAEWLRRAMTYNPHSARLIEYLAQCYVQQENYHEAGETYNHLTELSPNDPRGSIREAMSYFLAGNGVRAIDILNSKITKYPNSFEMNYTFGMILAAEDKPHRAISYLTEACRMRPESVDAQWKLGLTQGLTGHLMEAIHHLQQAHRLEPGNHWLLAQLSLAAAQARHQGIEIELETQPLVEVDSNPNQKSLDQLAELIVHDSDFVTAFLDLPGSDVDSQIFSSLLEILMHALERYPEYADLHYHCSCVYDRLGDSDKAIHESQKALTINPRYLNALIHLAKLYARTSRNDEAITRLQEAISLGANYADVHYLLGKMYHRQGSLENAKRHYEEALKINRNFRAAEEALALMAA